MQQVRQTQLDRITQQQNDTAVILERVAGRLDALEKWQDERDRERERDDQRRDSRDDLGIRLDKGTIAILISLVTTCLLVWNVAHH